MRLDISKDKLIKLLKSEMHTVFLRITSLRIIGNKVIYNERLNDIILDREKANHHKNIIKILYENIDNIDNYYISTFDDSPFSDLVVEVNDELTTLILLELI